MNVTAECGKRAPGADHNGRVHRPVLLLATLGLLAGCAANGPSRDVRVVSAAQLAARPDATADVAADPARDDEVAAVEGQSAAGHEDRPGSFGTIAMPRTVAVVGDSLTVAATDEISGALARLGIRSVIVDGRESRRMATSDTDLPSGVVAIEAILDVHEPDLWIVALGTNDVGAAVGPERFVADLRETIGAIPGTQPVVWVDVWIRDRLTDVVAANTLLRDELGRRAAPSVVVDWFSNGQVDGVITGDGVHLTEAGEERFASAIADAVLGLAAAG